MNRKRERIEKRGSGLGKSMNHTPQRIPRFADVDKAHNLFVSIKLRAEGSRVAYIARRRPTTTHAVTVSSTARLHVFLERLHALAM